MKSYNIAVVGTGYVGLSMSVLLSQHNHVTAIDIVPEKVEMINKRISPVNDEYISRYLSKKALDLTATTDSTLAYKNADFVIISTPTNYDLDKDSFDTSVVESVIKQVLSINSHTSIIIKSTVPIGFTARMRSEFNCNHIFFSPEFLRESKALYDNLYPSRIIVSTDRSNPELLSISRTFAELLKQGALKENIDTIFMNSNEAEAVKLFSNTYLALRVSFFNELDSYAESNGLETKDIINGVCLDPRIGNQYNNPSFGYGGYCLTKDTKELLSDYHEVPENLIKAIVDSNESRMDFITNRIILKSCANHFPGIKFDPIQKNDVTVGIYRLSAKMGSDNFRHSSILGIIKRLESERIRTLIYEPSLSCDDITYGTVINDFDGFKSESDCIVANRYDNCLDDVINKVYTRDLFNKD